MYFTVFLQKLTYPCLVDGLRIPHHIPEPPRRQQNSVLEDLHLCLGLVHSRHSSCVLGGSGGETSRTVCRFVLYFQGLSLP